MGRLTEAIHFYNSKNEPSDRWMEDHYFYFRPTIEDSDARKKYQKELTKPKKKRIIQFDMFEGMDHE